MVQFEGMEVDRLEDTLAGSEEALMGPEGVVPGMVVPEGAVPGMMEPVQVVVTSYTVVAVVELEIYL